MIHQFTKGSHLISSPFCASSLLPPTTPSGTSVLPSPPSPSLQSKFSSRFSPPYSLPLLQYPTQLDLIQFCQIETVPRGQNKFLRKYTGKYQRWATKWKHSRCWQILLPKKPKWKLWDLERTHQNLNVHTKELTQTWTSKRTVKESSWTLSCTFEVCQIFFPISNIWKTFQWSSSLKPECIVEPSIEEGIIASWWHGDDVADEESYVVVRPTSWGDIQWIWGETNLIKN